MQVWSGRRAGRADPADHLPRADRLTGPDQDQRLVPVAGAQPLPVELAVVDAGVVAVAAVPAGARDPAAGGGDDRGTRSGPEVDAGMQLPDVVVRVEPVAARAGQPARDRPAPPATAVGGRRRRQLRT